MTDFPAVIDLSGLGTPQGFTIQGAAASDRVGFSVSSAGDINGDGFDDIIIGAHEHDIPGGSPNVGEAYVIFGKANLSSIDLANLDVNDGFIIQNDAAEDRAGRSVSSAGDINGDGIDDIIVGAPNGGFSGAPGMAYVIFGKDLEPAKIFGNIDLTNLPAAQGFIIQGDVMNGLAGYSVSSAGDVNNDGFEDIIVGAPERGTSNSNAGKAYVIFGKEVVSPDTFGNIDLGNLGNNGFIIQGDAAADRAGFSVSSAGDINGDGIDDIIVGAPNGDDGGGDAGEAYVIFGKNLLPNAFPDIDLMNFTELDGFILKGAAVGGGDQAGFSVSSAGDVNGDGFADIIVGAPYAEGVSSPASEGEVYVIFGTNTGFGDQNTDGIIDLKNLSPPIGFVIQGDDQGDEAGRSVSSAGDINGDGFDDIIIGAPADDLLGNGTGEAYVIFGKAMGLANFDLTNLDVSDGFIIRGAAAGDNAGQSVSSAGDINGDGFADIIIGAPGADRGSIADAGEAYVIFGQAPKTAVNRVGSAADQVIFGGDFDDALSGLGGNDTLIGGAGNDTLDGGEGDDSLDGGSGNNTASYLSAGSAVAVDLNIAAAQNTGGAGSDKLSNIQNLIGSAYNDTLTGDGGDNSLEGGVGNDTLIGGDGDDTLEGGAGNNTASYLSAVSAVAVDLGGSTASGGAGSDTLTNIENLIGSSHGDTLTGDSGDNSLEGGDGNDTLDGGTGIDTASYFSAGSAVAVDLNIAAAQDTGGAGSDTLSNIQNLIGSAHNDTLTGDGGDNSLEGGVGNDTLIGGDGDDTLHGGAGNNTASYLSAVSAVAVDLGASTASGGAGSDTLSNIQNLIGSAHNDMLTGDGGNNTLEGGAGADTLEGGEGVDTLQGGDGDDTLEGGAEGDTLDGGGGFDTVSYANAGGLVAVYVDAPTLNFGDAAGDSFISIEAYEGSAHNDFFIGSNVNGDSLSGLAGIDQIFGHAGNDTIDGGADFDYILGGAGDDSIDGGAGLDILSGDNGADTINGGDDFDQIYGGAGNDSLNGDGDSDYLFGGTDNDTLNGDAGEDFLFGEAGDDVLNGDAAYDLLQGGDGNDTLFGGDDGVSIVNGLIGQGGDDRLIGGTGVDYMTGGDGATDTGNDTFVFTSGGGVDVVLDFQAGAGIGDVIEIDSMATGINSFAQLQSEGRLIDVGIYGGIVLGTADVVYLQNVASGTLVADDFSFV